MPSPVTEPLEGTDVPDWVTTPEESDAGPPAPSQEQMHAAARRAEQRSPVQAAGIVSPHEDLRFAADVGHFTNYAWKPLPVMIVCGSLALMLLLGQLWWTDLREALGWTLLFADGWVRLAMIFLGAYMAFLAWPTFRYRDWTPEREAEEDATHEYFRSKRGR